jgi:hypothetical protein
LFDGIGSRVPESQKRFGGCLLTKMGGKLEMLAQRAFVEMRSVVVENRTYAEMLVDSRKTQTFFIGMALLRRLSSLGWLEMVLPI